MSSAWPPSWWLDQLASSITTVTPAPTAYSGQKRLAVSLPFRGVGTAAGLPASRALFIQHGHCWPTVPQRSHVLPLCPDRTSGLTAQSCWEGLLAPQPSARDCPGRATSRAICPPLLPGEEGREDEDRSHCSTAVLGCGAMVADVFATPTQHSALPAGSSCVPALSRPSLHLPSPPGTGPVRSQHAVAQHSSDRVALPTRPGSPAAGTPACPCSTPASWLNCESGCLSATSQLALGPHCPAQLRFQLVPPSALAS